MLKPKWKFESKFALGYPLCTKTTE